MTRRPLVLCAGLVVFTLYARASSAQQLGPFITGVSGTYAPPMSQDRGVQLGQGALLHLGVSVEGGYDTNVFYNDADRIGSSLIRVTPYLDLTNANRAGEAPSALFYDLNAALTYREYLSDQEDVTRLRAFVPTIRGSLSHNANGTLGLTVTEAYTRAEDAPYYRGLGQSLIIRNNNVASAQLAWSPGGGRLQGLLRYTNTLDIFETEYLKPASSIGHEAMADVSWRWLPKTALYLQVRQGYITYLNDNPPGSPLGEKYSSFPLRAVLGIRGLITEKTSVAVGLGYQNAFYSNGTTTGGFLGSTSAAAELVVLPIISTRIAVGARHDFQNSVIGNFYYNDGVYASLSQQTVARLVGQVWGSFDYRRYHGLSSLGGSDERNDKLVQAGATLDYFLKSWAYAGLSYTLAVNRSDYAPLNANLGGASYTKQMVFARVGVTY